MNYRVSGLLAAASLSVAVLTSGVPAVSAAEAGSVSGALAQAQAHTYPGEDFAQYRRYGYRRGGYGRGYRGRGYGGAVGAGIAGLAAGALIGGAIASSQAGPLPPGTPVGNVYGRDPNAVQYCASRYRSYDPGSGTFLANDGMRYSCP